MLWVLDPPAEHEGPGQAEEDAGGQVVEGGEDQDHRTGGQVTKAPGVAAQGQWPGDGKGPEHRGEGADEHGVAQGRLFFVRVRLFNL